MEQKTFARILRKKQTDPEKTLWYYVRDRRLEGFKFRRQHRLAGYVVDFICLERSLIVELDGGQHATQERYDEVRTATLETLGFRVLRFWNNQVMGETDAVLSVIREELLRTPSPQPSPPAGERG